MKVICFGDSLTACGGPEGRFSDILQDRFPGHRFLNRGVGGESFVEGRARFAAEVLAEEPDVVLIEFGANDWWRDERPPRAWADDLEHLVTTCLARSIQPVVLGVFGPYLDRQGERRIKEYGFDERAAAYQALEAAVARKHSCPYVANIQETIIGRRTCWRDANHPNEYGNRHVADTIEPILERLLHIAPCPIRTPRLHTVRDLWEEAVALAPGRLAVIDGPRRLTYGEADLLVEQVAAGLTVRAGTARPKVAIYLPNCLEYYLLYWAVMRLGGVVVPLNTWLKQESLEAIFHSVQPDILVVRSPADATPLAATRAAAPKDIIGLGNWEEVLTDAETLTRMPIADEAPAIIMHTSGTTAAPKGAVMRHVDLLFNVMTTINAHAFNTTDTHLLVNPMFHCTALYSSLTTAAYTKTPVVITDTTSPDKLMGLVEEHGVTTFLSTPAVFQRLLTLRNLSTFDAGSLRLIGYAGSPMPINTIAALQAAFPDVALHNFFGLTETISMTHVLRGDEAAERPDSIGRLLPFVEALVVAEDDTPCPPGTVGELLFARENVISTYHNDAERLAQSLCTLDDRTWFRTGDLALVDEEGYFFIKGRRKDMIIVGGENVFATEVEAALQAHPAVAEAAVKGRPARGALAFLGEQVYAWVAVREAVPEKALRKHCFAQLPSYKVPHRIFFVAELPRNPSGKVVKDELALPAPS